MKFLITGSKGQLGYDCVRKLEERGFNDVVGIDYEELDITHKEDVLSFVKNYAPDVIIHCAGYTAVDRAEEDIDKVYKVNVLGTRYLAEAAEENNCKMVYISTDYVFDGSGDDFYEPYDLALPLSAYGKSKFDGEKAAAEKCSRLFIVRISWAFGINGNNFVKTMLKLSETNHVLNIVSDQIGSPTYTYDLSDLLIDMVLTEKYGVYHATNEGVCSWAEFAEEIFKLSKRNIIVKPISTNEYKAAKPKQAVRPLNSRLSKKCLDKAGFRRLPSWENALERYLKELNII